MGTYNQYGEIGGHSRSEVIALARGYAEESGYYNLRVINLETTGSEAIKIAFYEDERDVTITVKLWKRNLGLVSVKAYDGKAPDAGCHITDVVCKGMGLPDDCRELQLIRHFRDTYLVHHGHRAEVDDYYRNSRHYAQRIAEVANGSHHYYEELFTRYIAPAVEAIARDRMPEAYDILNGYLSYIKGELVSA